MLQKTALGIVFSIAAYVATGIYAYWPASLLSSTRLVGGGIGDSAGQVNAMSWTPYAISHGLNLFFTNAMNYPEGFNLASNAFFPLIGIIAWPITATLGPIAAVNFAFVLAFVASATAMFVVLWQITRFLPGAFLGGLLYGFSPYMVGQGLGHLAILFQPIPPIVLFLLLKLLGDTRRSGRSVGIALGIAVGLQAYIAIEVIATMALVAIIAVVLVGIMRWRELRPHISRILVGLTWAIGTFAVIAGYPLAYLLVGPRHLSGPPQPLLTLDSYRVDLLGPIVPTLLQRFAPAHFAAIGSSYAVGNVAENGIYIGIPLLVVSIAIGVVCWRNLLIRTCLLVAFVSYVLALGPSLVVNGHSTGIWLPFALLTHVPFVSGEVPGRYSLYVDLALSTTLAVGMNELKVRIDSRQRQRANAYGRSRRGSFAGASVLIVGAALVPLVPKFPIATATVSIPRFFQTHSLEHIPNGSVMLAYPYPEPGAYDQALVWQAVANWRFKIIGGYAIFRGLNGAGSPYPTVLRPSIVQNLFDVAYYNESAPPGESSLGRLSPISVTTTRSIRTFLRSYHVGTIVMDPTGDDPELVIRYLDPVIGVPQMIGGVYAWLNVPKLVREHLR